VTRKVSNVVLNHTQSVLCTGDLSQNIETGVYDDRLLLGNWVDSAANVRPSLQSCESDACYSLLVMVNK